MDRLVLRYLQYAGLEHLVCQLHGLARLFKQKSHGISFMFKQTSVLQH